MRQDARVLPKDRVDAWVAQLQRGAQVIAPVIAEGGDAVFAPIRSPGQVLWQFANPLAPPRQFVLPQTDPIVSIRRGEEGHQVASIVEDQARIILNLRSCDVAGLAFLTRVHLSDLPDEAYRARRQRTTLISLACPAPLPRCFCVCTGSGPFLDDGFDIQLTDLGAALFAEPGSDAGRRLLDEAGALLRAPRPAEVNARRALEEGARALFGDQTCHFASAMRRISTRRVEDALWEAIGDSCLECGGCTMVCPTCYCFSVKDRQGGAGEWTRCRIWDSCQYAAFTLEASGHNPRPARKDRIKRRFYHKVSAQYYAREGMVGCVGCGRCVTACLGGADMPAVVAAIRKGAWNG